MSDTTTTTNEPMSQDQIKGLVTPHITVDSGVIKVDKAAVETAAGAVDLDIKKYRKDQEKAATITGAIVEAAGELSTKAMEDDESVERNTGTFKIGHESINMTHTRQSSITVPGRDGAPTTQKTVHGHMRLSRKSVAGAASIKEVRNRISEAGTARLGK